jgi:hypothetical protein
MFSLVNDANFQIVWRDGKTEKDTKRNAKRGVASLSSLKKFTNGQFSWTTNRIETAYEGRHRATKDAFTDYQDTFNKRIIFRIIPRSINLNVIGEPVDEK